jgi:hypothetical protein
MTVTTPATCQTAACCARQGSILERAMPQPASRVGLRSSKARRAGHSASCTRLAPRVPTCQQPRRQYRTGCARLASLVNSAVCPTRLCAPRVQAASIRPLPARRFARIARPVNSLVPLVPFCAIHVLPGRTAAPAQRTAGSVRVASSQQARRRRSVWSARRGSSAPAARRSRRRAVSALAASTAPRV